MDRPPNSPNSPESPDRIEVLVGRIGKPHGLRGEVSIDVRTDEPEVRFEVGRVLRVEPPQGSTYPHRQLTVRAGRWHSSSLLVAFAEIADRNDSEAARGLLLYAEVDPTQPPADPDEFYDHQLIGLTAFDLAGQHLGQVTRLVHGAQDLLTIRTEDGRDALVPFVAALVPEVDVAGGRIVIADRPGLVAPFADEAAT